jgi:hypothetical protein
MAIFPDHSAIKPLVGYEAGEIENVRRNPAEAGATQIRDLWGGLTKFYAEFEYELGTAAAHEFLRFRRANRALTFTFYDIDLDAFDGENIGTGDGSNLIFTIPAKETANRVVRVAGVLRTAGTHYNVTSGTGSLGEDRVVFTAGNAPTNGQAVTIDYIGRHRYNCEFVAPLRKVIVSGSGRRRLPVRVEQAL